MDRSCGIDLQRWRKCGDLFGFDLEAGCDAASKHSWDRDGWGDSQAVVDGMYVCKIMDVHITSSRVEPLV
jgi:hypothetical protein